MNPRCDPSWSDHIYHTSPFLRRMIYRNNYQLCKTFSNPKWRKQLTPIQVRWREDITQKEKFPPFDYSNHLNHLRQYWASLMIYFHATDLWILKLFFNEIHFTFQTVDSIANNFWQELFPTRERKDIDIVIDHRNYVGSTQLMHRTAARLWHIHILSLRQYRASLWPRNPTFIPISRIQWNKTQCGAEFVPSNYVMALVLLKLLLELFTQLSVSSCSMSRNLLVFIFKLACFWDVWSSVE